jgi:hypothetical protein
MYAQDLKKNRKSTRRQVLKKVKFLLQRKSRQKLNLRAACKKKNSQAIKNVSLFLESFLPYIASFAKYC